MAGIVDRVKNILLSPKTEWPVIDAESGDTKEVFTYVASLATLPVIGGIIGGLIAFPGLAGFFVVSAIFGYLLTFAIVYLIAFIINALAPTFNSEPHMPSALKLTAYSYTAAWVAGIFNVIPFVGSIIALIGALYSLYLLYLGIPVLMRTPQDKAIGYTIVIIICAIVVTFVIAFIVTILIGAFGFSALR
jgi:MFS family permease